MGQYVAIKGLAQLAAERATAYTACKATKYGARHRTKGDTDRASHSAYERTSLTTGQCSCYATGCTA